MKSSRVPEKCKMTMSILSHPHMIAKCKLMATRNENNNLCSRYYLVPTGREDQEWIHLGGAFMDNEAVPGSWTAGHLWPIICWLRREKKKTVKNFKASAVKNISNDKPYVPTSLVTWYSAMLWERRHMMQPNSQEDVYDYSQKIQWQICRDGNYLVLEGKITRYKCEKGW